MLFKNLKNVTHPPLRGCVITGKEAVIPAQAGIQARISLTILTHWMPASAGMTNYDTTFQIGGGRGLGEGEKGGRHPFLEP